MENYRILQVIGEGTYGKVFKAQERDTGRVVAIKKFKQREEEDPHVKKTMLREIRILKEQRHVNIVNLRHHFREQGKLYLIFDYVQRTLLEELQASPDGLPFDRIKSITYQILRANNYLHESKIIHRDIKPENLLISKAGLVKLCDFGFARPLNSSPTYQYTDYVSTRWYRAPELLVGDAAYSGTVDVWAIGCIFSEIYNGMPLFPGDSDLHTLQLILETITADDMEHGKEIQELSKKQRVAFRMNPLFENMSVPKAAEAIKTPETIKEVSLKSLLKGITDTQLDFLRRCLIIDGGQRATLQELLEHPIFDEEFRRTFDEKLVQMEAEDEKEFQALMTTKLTTKDGRDELSPEELLTEEEKNVDDSDDEDDFDDDDDSSNDIGSGGSSDGSAGSSSGVGDNRPSQRRQKLDLLDHEEGSFKTAMPAMGDGLIPSNDSSMKNLLGEHSIGSIEKISAGQKTDASEKVDEFQKSKVLLLSSKKSLEPGPLTQHDQNSLASETGQSLGPNEEQKPAKEVKNLRESLEQLQKQQASSQKSKKQQEQEILVLLSKSPDREVSTYAQNSAERNYFNVDQKTQDSHHALTAKAQKRASLTQYMIEQSITEEVREENISEKTSSQRTSSNATPSQVQNEQEDLMIVREGITQMFTHGGSRQDTEQASGEKSPDDIAEIKAGSSGSLTQIKLGAQIIIKETSNSKGVVYNVDVDSQGETKHTSDPQSSELRRPDSLGTSVYNEGQMSRARTFGGGISQTSGSQGFPGTQISNPMSLKQQHTEGFTRQTNKSNGNHNGNQSTSGSKGRISGGAPQISKVNITFGASAQQQQSQPTSKSGINSHINLQVSGQQEVESASRQSSHNTTTPIGAIGGISAEISQGFAVPLGSSRAVVNNSNGGGTSIQPQRSSISLKQMNHPVNQTAREFTPNKKPSLVAPSPSTSNAFGVDGSVLRQKGSIGFDSTTATKNSQGYGAQQNSALGLQEMTVTQFSGKPIYQLHQYPQTQIKGPGPKQAAVLKQTSSLEKLDNLVNSPQKLPNLKPTNSSMSQYGQAGLHAIHQKPTTSEEQRIGEGLMHLQKTNNRQGPNSISNHFNSQQQRYGGSQIGQSMTSGQLASGSTHSLKTKMNFTSQNYHRASNSQTNEPSMTGPSGKVASITIPDVMTAKKSQMIQPLKLVAFPKLSADEQQSTASPANSQVGISVGNAFSHNGQTKTVNSTMVGSKQKGTGNNNTMFSKATSLQKRTPHAILQQQQLTSKTQSNKVPKRYSDMGIMQTGSVTHNAKFAYNHGLVTNGPEEQPQTFHPSLTNEYMLSQDSLVLNEVKSRQSSTHNHEALGSVETRKPRNQVASQTNSQTKSRAAAATQVTGNGSFHSTMKSKNNKFIHQNSNTSKVLSVNSSTAVQMSKINPTSQGKSQKPPQTSAKKIHQHFLEEFQEVTSQRQSLTRSKNVNEPLAAPSQAQLHKTPMTSLFQKSKFFQSNTSNLENNPNSLNAPSTTLSQINHYGQYQQSTSPARPQLKHTVQQQNEINQLSNFTETKDSFPRRNITNKLRNANNAPPKQNAKFVKNDGPNAASITTSPSPLSFYNNRNGDKAYKNNNGVILPNLSSSGNHPASSTAPHGTFTGVQPHLMQVSLTQLKATGPEQRNGQHLSQSPNIKKSEQTHLGGQKLSAAVQLNASEFNLRLTNESQLSGGAKSQVPYTQIVRQQPSVIQPGRAQQYQMYLTPSQNYTSGANQQSSLVSRASKNVIVQKKKAQGNINYVNKAGQMSSPSNLGEKVSYENSFQVQKGLQMKGGGQKHGSPAINPNIVYKVKTETDWHRGSQQLFEVPNQGQLPSHLYRVSNQFLEKSISPQRIQYAIKRGSNAQIPSIEGSTTLVGGLSGNYTENKINFTNQSIRKPAGGGNETQEGSASSGMIGEGSQDNLAVQSPNLLRKKIISKQQNQIK